MNLVAFAIYLRFLNRMCFSFPSILCRISQWIGCSVQKTRWWRYKNFSVVIIVNIFDASLKLKHFKNFKAKTACLLSASRYSNLFSPRISAKICARGKRKLCRDIESVEDCQGKLELSTSTNATKKERKRARAAFQRCEICGQCSMYHSAMQMNSLIR